MNRFDSANSDDSEPRHKTSNGSPQSGSTCCPRCRSSNVQPLHRARRIVGTIGTTAGAIGGAASALTGSEIGFAIGAAGGPPGAALGVITGAITGAILGALTGGARGCAIGAALGEAIDITVLDKQRCARCSYTFNG